MITLSPLSTVDVPMALHLMRIREMLLAHREPAVNTRAERERAKRLLLAHRAAERSERVRKSKRESAARQRAKQRELWSMLVQP